MLAPGREDITGLDSADLISISAKQRRRFLCDIQRHRQIELMYLEIRTPDGREIPLEVTARMLEFEDQQAIVCGLLDVSERQRAEAEITKQREALAQSEKMSAMGSLLASVSHELNNPLSIIVGQSQLLEEMSDDPKTVDRAQRVKNAADRCARIVRTFLAMARQKAPDRAGVPVNDLIRDAIELTDYAIKTSSIELALDLPTDTPTVIGDRDQLLQVVVNILINAQQAMLEHEGTRKITISTQTNDQRLLLNIADTGPGVPEDLRTRIFEAFYTTKAEGKGTGIGLAVCKSILDAHGGALAIEDASGGGATFVIELPLGDADDVQTESADLAHRWTLLPNLTILVVDDEAGIAETARDLLSVDGHRVLLANNGQEALEYLTVEEIDVIVSDLRMPGMDGPTLWRTIDEAGSFPVERIGFITGDTFDVSARRFAERTGAPLIEKPFAGTELKQLVLEILEQGY